MATDASTETREVASRKTLVVVLSAVIALVMVVVAVVWFVRSRDDGSFVGEPYVARVVEVSPTRLCVSEKRNNSWGDPVCRERPVAFVPNERIDSVSVGQCVELRRAHPATEVRGTVPCPQ